METALQTVQACEEPGSAAASALEDILEDVTLARANATPICQDAGTPIFYISHPQGMGTRRLRVALLLKGGGSENVSAPVRSTARSTRRTSSACRGPSGSSESRASLWR